MCLFVKTNTPLKAKENIIVFKLMRVCDNYVISPYHENYYLLNHKYTANAITNVETYSLKQSLLDIERSHLVCENFFHSFEVTNYKDLKILFKDPLMNGFPIKLIQCIIPKGSLYFYGNQMEKDGPFGYASREIVFKEITTKKSLQEHRIRLKLKLH